MPETRANSAPAVSRRALRILLFGRPGAGKTSLLGALAVAARKQGAAPAWHLTDLAHRLDELRQRVEQNQPQPTITPDQIVPYPIRLEERATPQARPRRFEACLLDCDGNAALQLLNGDASTDKPASDGPLAEALLAVDALILVIPAGEVNAGPEADDRLMEFLQFLEEERGEEVRTSGLPVVPVLTKCDLLARPGDSLADWIDRVQEHRLALEQRLQQFSRTDPAAFGQVRLQPVMATAMHRPVLVGQPPETDRPYGVADLFQVCLDRAWTYRRHAKRSTWRLLLLVLVLLLLLTGMILVGLVQRGVRTPADRLALQAALQHATDRYQQLRRQALHLESFADFPLVGGAGVPWAVWYQKGDELLAEAHAPQPPPETLLPGADTVTYENVFNADEVRQARLQWVMAEEQLIQRRNLVAALGLVEPQPDRPALLKIPPPPDFLAEQSRQRLDALARIYPDYTEWSLDHLPRPVAQEMNAAIQTSERNLIAAGQREILQQLQKLRADGRETPELWQQLRVWLNAPAELTAWRDLVGVVMHLSDPRAEDPVVLLRNFLDKPRHGLELQRLVVKIPDALKVTPAGKLSIFLGTLEEVRTTLIFQQWGEPLYDPDEKTSRYPFVPEAGETITYRLAYRPGEVMWAELPLRTDDKQERLFTWSLCRSQVFQFERLIRPPRLHRPDQLPTQGELTQEVALTVPVGIVPRLPDLIPVVKWSRKE